MRLRISLLTAGIFLLAQAPHIFAAEDANSFWPQWRGPSVNGVSVSAEPPTEWSETKNVKWKTKIPGFGTSTPIVWGNRVFILTAVSTGKKVEPKPEEKTEKEKPASDGRRFGGEPAPDELFQFVVLCLDRASGKTIWQKVAREEKPHEGHHKDHGFASASPVTDGKLLIAYFGSRGVYCYDFDGNLKWEKDLGNMQTRNGFGEGASPALHGNTVIINWDDETENDFIVALDKNTGKELWRTPRSEPTGWATPLIVQHSGKTEAVINATDKVRGYDITNGKEIWSCGGQTANAIPTPVANKDTVFVMSGFRGNALNAIQLGRTGDLTGTDAIRWSHSKSTPYVPSPLLVDDLLYFVSGNNAMISCFDAKTGKAHFEAERLDGIFGIYASPVFAKDKVYMLGREGTCLILKKGPKLEVIGKNKIDDKTDASLALVGKEIFLRGHENLYCIGEK